MADKKNKSKIAKKRAKKTAEKKKKRSLRLVKLRSGSEPQIIERSALPDMGAPEGFRSISMSQAMMEYAKPLMKHVEGGNDLNIAFQASTLFWNYSTTITRGQTDNKLEKDLLKAVKSSFGMDKHEADGLIKMMVDRYNYLFPEDIQPTSAPFMFIRKEVRYLIKPFDYEKLTLSDEMIPPDREDMKIIARLEELDEQIYSECEYGEYEKLLFSLKDECEARFEKWLVAKGFKDDPQEFSFCLGIYFDFIYGYGHDEIVIFKSVPEEDFVEFFEDFLIRKMMAEPPDYIYWPPALKLFYQFLYEKKYLDKPKTFIGVIDKIEPYFIEVLKKQFS